MSNILSNALNGIASGVNGLLRPNGPPPADTLRPTETPHRKQLIGGDSAAPDGGPPGGGPPPRRNIVAEKSIAATQDTAGNSIRQMELMNDQQDRMAAVSATMQANAALRAQMLQTVRDITKDAKDAIKDQGEAGHKG
jgi:hypothetical protein